MSLFAITGGFTDIAVSSRVRLARNITGYPFHLNEAQKKEIADKVYTTLKNTPAIGVAFTQRQIVSHSPEAAQLVEQRLISPELADRGGWLILSDDNGVAIMIGEEDHIRLQTLGVGLCPKECLETANKIADLLGNALPYAYDERLGYLTACPTNIGTGLRTSIMLHLPILTETGNIQQVAGYAGSCGCAVRGAYGEGSKAIGGFYQISNQITLGVSAVQLTEKLIQTVTAIIDAEKKIREQVRSKNESLLCDRVRRAAGTMKSAWMMDSREAIQCISDVLVGLQMGYLSGIAPQTLYALEQTVRPAMLKGSPQERDQKRAQMVREAANDISFTHP